MTELTPKRVAQALVGKALSHAELATQLRQQFGKEALEGGVFRIEETMVLWAVTSPESPKLVTRTYAEDGSVWPVWEAPQPDPRPDILANASRNPMQRLGDSDLYVEVRTLPNFSATAFRYETAERRFGDSWVVLEHYMAEPECRPQPGVPQGTVTEYGPMESHIFGGTLRGYWLYVPAQYVPNGTPVPLMVFQDGGMYLSPQAPVPTVFDNLIHTGEMPVAAALFVNPGTFPDRDGRFQNRIAEYHDRTDAYARFLRDEMLPLVAQHVHLSTEPGAHAIGGLSSGAVCAFNAAWHMPELFGKVLSHCGSFTNINGSHNTWAEIRQSERKPLRIYMQGSANDIDDVCGNWPLANQEVAAALRFRGYDYKLDWGRGFHSLAHGGATLPSALRWLWRE